MRSRPAAAAVDAEASAAGDGGLGTVADGGGRFDAGHALLERSNRGVRDTRDGPGAGELLRHDVSEDVMMNEPEMLELRYTILMHAVETYEGFLKKHTWKTPTFGG